MDIVQRSVKDLVPYAKNAKKHDQKQVANVAESIRQYGFVQPVVVDRDGVIVIGHCRVLAAKKLGMADVPCVCVDDLTPEKVNALRLVDNKTNESAWDLDLLAESMKEADLDGFDLAWGVADEIVASDEMEDIVLDDEGQTAEKSEKRYEDFTPGILRSEYINPPFSVLDARRGEWQSRKKAWGEIIVSGNGREAGLLGDGLLSLAKSWGCNLNGTSIFDPCLCETLLYWFSPRGGKIIDPFAVGSVRGLVASYMDRQYHGCDLRQQQIDENIANYKSLKMCKDFFGGALQMPHWYCGDSLHIDEIIAQNEFDCLLTCPPYADLEVYSDDPADLSTMPYDKFVEVYSQIFEKSIQKLKPNAFVVVVVGEVRDPKGYYRNFCGDTIAACEKAGAKYYNEIILVQPVSTGAMRCRSQFNPSRKVVNVHQKVLVFCKGDARAATTDLEKYDFPEFDEEKEG